MSGDFTSLKRSAIYFAFFVLCSSAFPDDVDDFILSYLESRRLRQEFDWDRANSVNRSMLTSRLQEVVDGKRRTFGFGPANTDSGYCIGKATAKAILCGLGDMTTIEIMMVDYHVQRVGWKGVRELVEVGQPLAIPYFAADLTSDEFLYFDILLEDGKVHRVKVPSKRRESSDYVLNIVARSAVFSVEVRDSAEKLRAFKYSDTKQFEDSVRSWWQQNQSLIEFNAYGEVSAFPRIDEPEDAAQPTVESPSVTEP